jgi:pilus assembly protein CpaE
MNTAAINLDKPKQGLFCVCTDDTVANIAGEAAAKVNGCVYFGGFHEYITAAKRPQFSPQIRAAKSCVALIDFDRDPELALQTAERLQQLLPQRLSVIGVSHAPDPQLLMRAMRIGCVDYLSKPVGLMDLSTALTRFQAAAQTGEQSASKLGRVLAFFGAKGGVGTTTLAVHLATFLVRQHQKRILLIDHKHQLGHVALYLGLKETQYHFTALLRSADRLDSGLLDGFVLRHESGLDVIASPETATGDEHARREDLERVMDFLRSQYDYILVDSSVSYEDSKSSLIDHADDIYLISTPDVAALRDLARLVEKLSLGEAGMSKLRLVINRATAEDSISSQLIQKAVRFPVNFSINNSYFEVMKAINAGEPIVPDGKSGFSQQIAAWAKSIADDSDSPAAQKSRFAFWKKKD